MTRNFIFGSALAFLQRLDARHNFFAVGARLFCLDLPPAAVRLHERVSGLQRVAPVFCLGGWFLHIVFETSQQKSPGVRIISVYGKQWEVFTECWRTYGTPNRTRRPVTLGEDWQFRFQVVAWGAGSRVNRGRKNGGVV